MMGFGNSRSCRPAGAGAVMQLTYHASQGSMSVGLAAIAKMVRGSTCSCNWRHSL